MKTGEVDESFKEKLERIWTDKIPDRLDPDVKRYWRWWGLINFHIFFLPIAFPLLVMSGLSGAFFGLGICVVVYIPLILIYVIILFIYTNLLYNSFTFLLTEDMLLIERGVLFKTKTVVPYSRVQNVNIIQGPLQRLLGISSVYAQTAAVTYYGGRYGGGTGAHLPGIPFPDELAEIIMRKVRMYKLGEGLDEDVFRRDAEKFVDKYRQYIGTKRGY